MKRLVKLSFKKFYEINEFVVKTTPMRTHYSSKNRFEKWVWQKKKMIIKNLLDSLDYDSVIDVGCGDGGLFELIKNDCHYTGVDISSTQLTSFRRWLKKNGIAKKPKLIQADVTKKIPFRNGSFDLALVCDSLEHFLDPIKAMAEIRRVVKKDGFIVFSIPNEELSQLIRFLTGRTPIRSPDHLYSITVNDIKQHFPKIIKQFGIPMSLTPALNLINILLVQNEPCS